MTEEQVALVDEQGRVTGSAARSVVRRDNLLHSATAILVRDPGGRIYLHRRSDAKDWAPGHWDVAAGGVITAGEEPLASALRELAEELGITGAALTPLGSHLYADETVRCFEHVYETVWDGTVRHQPEEVADGRWVGLDELDLLLGDPSIPFVPDSRHLLSLLAQRGVGDYRELGAGRMDR